MSDTSEDLSDIIHRLNLLDAINCSNIESNEGDVTENSPQHSENLIKKATCLLDAAELTKKNVDPKIKAAQEKLPIFKKKADFLKALEENQVLIVIGETGSGKTTQLPQYLKEAGLHVKGRIGCTQLRRMAAKAVARRVAKEQGCKVGEEVGYTIRFDDNTCPTTQIQYMTDGILLRECTYDRTLTSYSAIILDESHERTVDTDILLGVLRWILGQRNDLKLIISSATLDSQKFSSYFFNATVFNISGRMYPVEVIYNPMSKLDYIDEAAKRVIQINEREDVGDIMVFMCGEQDIEELCDKLYDYRSSLYPKLVILPCFSALPAEEQNKIFDLALPGQRKVVIATNIAETSVTVDGIRYVIDSGYVKQKVYDHRKEMEILRKVRVSQAQAIQRTGRAGRLAPGRCYRLYTEHEFSMFVSGPEPEIKRSNLTSAVLLLKKMGFKDLSVFHFIDEPPAELIAEAELELKFFAAIDASGEITAIGKKMASFPLEPNLAKMLVVSEELNCAEEILTIVALLSVANIFIRPRKKQRQADIAKAKFYTNDGDLISMLNVYNQWLTYGKDLSWCKDNFIHNRLLHEACKIREQLYDLMKSREMNIKSAAMNTTPILKSICAGLIQNVAQKSFKMKHAYVTLPKNEIVFIHPGSALFRVHPSWVVYQKIVQTSKPFMRGITPIAADWLQEFTPAFRPILSGDLASTGPNSFPIYFYDNIINLL